MFAIPSLKNLMERSRQAFRANLKGSDAWIWPNNVYASAKVMAGLSFELFGFMDYIQRQKFAITADGANLDLHGDEFGIPRRPAGPARGFVYFLATDALTVAASAVLQRSDGAQYRALVGGSLPGAGTVSVEVIATADGKAGISQSGTSLSIVSGVTGPGAGALVTVSSGGIVGGIDVEDDETYRARILFRKRNPPHGGSAADYVLWGEQVSGVSRVFVEPLFAGGGTVRVFILMDQLYTNGIPLDADVARVADHILTVQPAGAIVTVTKPIAHPVNITISGLSPDTPDVRAAVKLELADMFFRRSRVAGSAAAKPNMPFLASSVSFSRSWIWQAVANAAGEDKHSIMVPLNDIPLLQGEIATLGTVTFAS